VLVAATAPVRVADVGGWTDTWFAERGAVCNIAVGPGARVEIHARTDEAVRIIHPQVGQDDLLQHAVTDSGVTGIDVHVRAAVPPGSALGTSASVLVALVAALAATDGTPLDADEVARRAHHVETVVAGRESGVQDHVAAAHGGVSWIEIDRYPTWARTEVAAPAGQADRLLTVHLGGTHDSSALHRAVIERAEAGDGHVHRVLAELTSLAGEARAALEAHDVDGWGAVLTAASAAQARLHPALVGDDHRAVGAIAERHGAAGWKVNGAGGRGGTVTVLGPSDTDRRTALIDALTQMEATVLDLTPSPGVQVSRRRLDRGPRRPSSPGS
jgi:D-glycero-alpha-D-manno-heptose-7-phosphate kinase